MAWLPLEPFYPVLGYGGQKVGVFGLQYALRWTKRVVGVLKKIAKKWTMPIKD
jgi:hypothetical protein